MGSDQKTAGVSMARIGETLKDAREKKSFTIDQVQKQTRIHSTVLKALEEGRCDNILTPTYVKSFLKKYAEYLGLDARQMLGEYAKVRPAQQPMQISITSKTEAATPVDLSRYFPVIRRVTVAIIVIALVMFIGGKASNILKRWKEARSAAAVKMQAKSVRAVPAPSKKKNVSSGPAVSKKEPVVKEQVAVKLASASVVTSIPKAVPLKLLVSVNQTVLVKVKADGNSVFSRVLMRGSVEQFTAKDRINIYVAKGEAIELFLNGRSLGSPGKGPIKDIEITRSGLKVK